AGPSPSDPGTEPASGAPSGGGGASARAGTRDQAVVEAFLKRVHEERGALGGFLEAASWIEIEDATLEMAFGAKNLGVRGTMGGTHELLSIRIAPEVVKSQDVEMLEDLVRAAVNEARRKIEEAMAEKVGALRVPGL